MSPSWTSHPSLPSPSQHLVPPHVQVAGAPTSLPGRCHHVPARVCDAAGGQTRGRHVLPAGGQHAAAGSRKPPAQGMGLWLGYVCQGCEMWCMESSGQGNAGERILWIPCRTLWVPAPSGWQEQLPAASQSRLERRADRAAAPAAAGQLPRVGRPRPALLWTQEQDAGRNIQVRGCRRRSRSSLVWHPPSMHIKTLVAIFVR